MQYFAEESVRLYKILWLVRCDHKQSCVVAGVFYSSDEYIKCLCADQSGKRSMKLVKRSKDVGDDNHN